MKVFSSLILSCTLICFWSCSDSGEPKIEGCIDSTACNYNADATADDGSCLENDCANECGGTAVLSGCDNVCNSTKVNDCASVCGGTAVEDACETCGGSITDATQCDCPVSGEVRDCNGECNGSAVLTDCGCGEAASDGTTGCCADGVGPNDETPDCAGVCGGSTVADECGVCGGDNSSCVNFSIEIQPIFTANCTGCHGGSGGLTLTSYTSLMESDVVVSGNSVDSQLIKKLKGTAGTQMPKNQNPLDDATIDLIETWIDEGTRDN